MRRVGGSIAPGSAAGVEAVGEAAETLALGYTVLNRFIGKGMRWAFVLYVRKVSGDLASELRGEGATLWRALCFPGEIELHKYVAEHKRKATLNKKFFEYRGLRSSALLLAEVLMQRKPLPQFTAEHGPELAMVSRYDVEAQELGPAVLVKVKYNSLYLDDWAPDALSYFVQWVAFGGMYGLGGTCPDDYIIGAILVMAEIYLEGEHELQELAGVEALRLGASPRSKFVDVQRVLNDLESRGLGGSSRVGRDMTAWLGLLASKRLIGSILGRRTVPGAMSPSAARAEAVQFVAWIHAASPYSRKRIEALLFERLSTDGLLHFALYRRPEPPANYTPPRSAISLKGGVRFDPGNPAGVDNLDCVIRCDVRCYDGYDVRGVPAIAPPPGFERVPGSLTALRLLEVMDFLRTGRFEGSPVLGCGIVYHHSSPTYHWMSAVLPAPYPGPVCAAMWLFGLASHGIQVVSPKKARPLIQYSGDGRVYVH
jgi:hypothetical protein